MTEMGLKVLRGEEADNREGEKSLHQFTNRFHQEDPAQSLHLKLSCGEAFAPLLMVSSEGGRQQKGSVTDRSCRQSICCYLCSNRSSPHD